MNSPRLHPILLAGPTAVGKSAVALLLAEQLDGEIVTVDSMQVYRGLDIGTAKPTAADRARVPHRLIDVVDLTGPFDAAQFVQLARKAVAEIQARSHVPILCGGTGLYFKAFLEGLSVAPPADPAARAELESTPLCDLLKELELRDPATFARIDRQNPRRVIRAVAVIRLTGKPFSSQQADWQRATRNTQHAFAFFGFIRASADLHARIDARVEKMFAQGLIEETRLLLERGLAQNPTAMQAIGYRQVVEHLCGRRSLPETIELVRIRTHQFARRQMTWFRRQLRLEWIHVKREDAPEVAAATVVSLVKARQGE